MTYRGSMDPSPHLRTLGAFLRARRAEFTPESVAGRLPVTVGHRRVPGLRREEVAQLIGVSTDYYTRVEQGRMAPSEQVLGTLGQTFRMTPEQRSYAMELLNLARGHAVPVPESAVAHDRLQLLLDQLTDFPALVLGPRMDILAWNPLSSALLLDFGALPREERNYVELTFTRPEIRSLYEDWDAVARTCVGILRREAARSPDDPELASLVGRLSIASEDFRRWWAEHRIAEQDFGAKVILHPVAGRMRLNWDSFTYAGAPGQQMILWSADAGSLDAVALASLAG
jgi:transcriptional regulator with XRE-family HTH domain